MPRSSANSENESQIGIRIGEIRRTKGISREKLAVLLTITQQQLSKYENGQNRVSGGNIRKICRALDCSYAELLGDEELERAEGSRLTMEVARSFNKLNNPALKSCISNLMRSLANDSI